MAEKQKAPAKLESREDLHRTETQPKKEGLAPANPQQRRPIAVSTHTEPHPFTEGFLRVTTLLFDDGSAWRRELDEVTEQFPWRQIYTLGDEEKSA